MLYIHRI